MRILLAEDDELLGQGIVTALTRNGYRVDWSRDGRQCRAALDAGQFNLVLLDLGLPYIDGMQLIRTLRARDEHTPVMILTARDPIEDRVAGLDAGADDYLIKPFALDELLARVRALVRREQGRGSNDCSIGSLRVSPAQQIAWLDERDLGLSPREFQVLHLLASRWPDPVSKRELERLMYGWDDSGSVNAIEVHIHNLRRKLAPQWIETRRGVGYVLAPPDDPPE